MKYKGGKTSCIYTCYVLGRKYDDNRRFISRICNGVYLGRKRQKTANISVEHIEILNVPNRDDILIHPLNYAGESKGCFGTGKCFSMTEENGDPETFNFSVYQSRKSLKEILDIMPDEFLITVM